MAGKDLIEAWKGSSEDDRKAFIEFICKNYSSPIAEVLHDCHRTEVENIKIGGTDPN
jgi:hypothetical protein